MILICCDGGLVVAVVGDKDTVMMRDRVRL